MTELSMQLFKLNYSGHKALSCYFWIINYITLRIHPHIQKTLQREILLHKRSWEPTYIVVNFNIKLFQYTSVHQILNSILTEFCTNSYSIGATKKKDSNFVKNWEKSIWNSLLDRMSNLKYLQRKNEWIKPCLSQ